MSGVFETQVINSLAFKVTCLKFSNNLIYLGDDKGQINLYKFDKDDGNKMNLLQKSIAISKKSIE